MYVTISMAKDILLIIFYIIPRQTFFTLSHKLYSQSLSTAEVVILGIFSI